jgi:DNA-binding phage protein
MTSELRSLGPADYLSTGEARAAHMTEAFASNGFAFIADALGVIARSQGIGKVAH